MEEEEHEYSSKIEKCIDYVKESNIKFKRKLKEAQGTNNENF